MAEVGEGLKKKRKNTQKKNLHEAVKTNQHGVSVLDNQWYIKYLAAGRRGLNMQII